MLINPELLEKSGETGIEEGCLSIPEQRALVPRAEKVKIRALDRDGKPFELEADGLLAICIGLRLGNGIYGHSRFCNTDFDDKLACLNLSGV